MNIETLNDRLRGIKIVPVIALERAEDAVPLGHALQKNGIPVAEITFRSAAAIDAIRRLRDALPDILIGAGTVLNAAQPKPPNKRAQTSSSAPASTRTPSKPAKTSASPSPPASTTRPPSKPHSNTAS